MPIIKTLDIFAKLLNSKYCVFSIITEWGAMLKGSNDDTGIATNNVILYILYLSVFVDLVGGTY